MIPLTRHIRILFFAVLLSLCSSSVFANAYREKDKQAKIARTAMTVLPPRDWNRLKYRPGKYTEVWTLDGEQLNEVTFYAGIQHGKPIVKERNKKHSPLPKFKSNILLMEIPELLEGTYRAHRYVGNFTLTSAKPHVFLGYEGVYFTYNFTDRDELPRKGEARATIAKDKLYMVTFDAPRLHYFERTIGDFRSLADTAALAE